MNEQLSFEEAKRLSIIKWEAIIKQNGRLNDIPEEIKVLRHQCGFCERHAIKRENSFDKDCNKCEFEKLAGKCNDDDSLYDRWLNTKSIVNRIFFSREILQVIESLKENS